MNKFIGTGRLTKDIELRVTPNGKSVISNTIAIRNDFKNANGEYESEFINIQVWNNQAEFLNKYASKGSKVLVEGRLTTRTYEKQDGTKGYVTEVIVSSIELLDAKKQENASNQKQAAPMQDTKQTDPFEEFGDEVELSGLDLPF